MHHPANPPLEVMNALEAFLANPGPTNGENDQELASALTRAGLVDHVNRRHLGLPGHPGEEPEGRTLATMPRTYEILFPRDLAREYGKAGLSIPVSSILRWFALREHEERASYFLGVAEALDEPDCVAPNIKPQWRDQTDRTRTLAELASWIANGDVELSHHGRSHVGGMIADAIREVLDDCYSRNVEIMMPTDALPGWIGQESQLYGIGMAVGHVLTHLAEDIKEADPNLARKLKRAVEKYYPDDTIEVEVTFPDETIYLVDFNSQRSRSIPWHAVQRIRPFPGSVDLRHYKDGSEYSSDDNAHPFRLVQCWLGDDDDDEESWEEGCLLFSDDLIVHASIARDTAS